VLALPGKLRLASPSPRFFSVSIMMAAEIVPYEPQNADLIAEVERLRQQVAQLEGVGEEYPDHQYDRQVNKAICTDMVYQDYETYQCTPGVDLQCRIECSEYFDGNPTPDNLQVQEDRTVEYTNGDSYKVCHFDVVPIELGWEASSNCKCIAI